VAGGYFLVHATDLGDREGSVEHAIQERVKMATTVKIFIWFSLSLHVFSAILTAKFLCGAYPRVSTVKYPLVDVITLLAVMLIIGWASFLLLK
jgi:hypothetical protein